MKSFKIILVLSYITLLMTSCGGSSDVAAHAAKFCSCTEELSNAEAKMRSGEIQEAAYQAIRAEQVECMNSKEDPREALETQQERDLFEREFVLELAKQCPEIGRSFGYNIP